MSSVGAFLAGLGLGHLEARFAENGVDMEALGGLTNEDLIELGVARLMDRKRILQEIRRLAALRSNGDGERRLISVLFCDLVDSTGLSQRMDPEDMREALRAYREVCVRSIQAYGGFLANFLGDGVVAYFGWPHASEEQASQAVRAGLKMIEALGRIELAATTDLHCRVGVATGRVVVGGGADHDTAIGETPNLAARLQTLADRDEIVIDDTTRRMIGRRFLAKKMDAAQLKGFPRPVLTWRVLSEDPNVDRFDARADRWSVFAGRREEIGRLGALWARTQAGAGVAVVVRGDPGIGKSRLVWEFCREVGDRARQVFRFQCSPFHSNTALHPVAHGLEIAAGLGAPDLTGPEKISRLRDFLGVGGDLDPFLLETFARFFGIEHAFSEALLKEPAAALRSRTLGALLRLLLGASARGPAIVVVEDVHWIDPSSEELLGMLVSHPDFRGIMLVATTRHGGTFRLPVEPEELDLPRLGDSDIAAIAQSVQGAQRLSGDEVADIVGRVDGMPLFAEELTSAILLDASGRQGLPENIQTSVMARLDHLGEAKFVAQVGALIGREFSRRDLAVLLRDAPIALDAALEALLKDGMIMWPNPPHGPYQFKHALVQDVAYHTLLREQRRHWHRRFATEALIEEDRRLRPEIVAHHLTEAGDIPASLEYWKAAGYRASRASANTEAMANFKRGLELIATLPPDADAAAAELGFLVGLAGPVIAVNGYTSDELGALIARAVEVSRRVGDAPEIFPLLYSRWAFSLTGGAMTESLGVAEQFSRLAESTGDHGALYARHRLLGASYMVLGRLREAREEIGRSINLYRSDEHERLVTSYGVDIRVASRCFMGEIAWLLGRPDSARRSASLALAEARALDHVHSIAMSLYFSGLVAFLRLDPEETGRRMDELFQLAARGPVGAWPTLGMTMRGWARAAAGDMEQGLKMMDEGIAAADRTGVCIFLPFMKCRMAQVRLDLGDISGARALAQEARAIIDRTGERVYEAEQRRLIGELNRREGRVPDAEAEFEAALAIARSQGARSLELRAAVAWGRLLAERDEASRARTLVEPILRLFDEGADCFDVQAARSLLSGLRAEDHLPPPARG